VPTRGRRSWYKSPRPDRPEGGLAPGYVAYDFVLLGTIIICRQINASRPSPSHSATGKHSFGFSVKVFSRSALADLQMTCLEFLAVQTNLISVLLYALYLQLRTNRLAYRKLVLLCVHGSSVAANKHRISKDFRSCAVSSIMT
jgi:hypothetical protein